MQTVADFLISYGYAGMFLAAFLAASILPFNSELVIVALFKMGLGFGPLLFWAALGNTLGGLLNYGIGLLGKEEWITKYAKVPPDKLQRGMAYVKRYGWWAGLLSWVPIIGDLITVALGYLRVNVALSVASMTIGKTARYWLILLACTAI